MASEPATIIYCCDADALIDLDSAGRFAELSRLVEQGRLRIASGAFAETVRFRSISRRSKRTLEGWHAHGQVGVVVDYDSAARSLLPDIDTRYGPQFSMEGVSYGGFWRSRAGRDAADAEVVAFAKAHGWVVISNDRSVHGACLMESVECHRWEHLALVIRQIPPPPEQPHLF